MKVENRVHPTDEQIAGFQEGDIDTPIYMQTGDALQGGASAAGDLEIFVSYDVIA